MSKTTLETLICNRLLAGLGNTCMLVFGFVGLVLPNVCLLALLSFVATIDVLEQAVTQSVVVHYFCVG